MLLPRAKGSSMVRLRLGLAASRAVIAAWPGTAMAKSLTNTHKHKHTIHFTTHSSIYFCHVQKAARWCGWERGLRRRVRSSPSAPERTWPNRAHAMQKKRKKEKKSTYQLFFNMKKMHTTFCALMWLGPMMFFQSTKSFNEKNMHVIFKTWHMKKCCWGDDFHGLKTSKRQKQKKMMKKMENQPGMILKSKNHRCMHKHKHRHASVSTCTYTQARTHNTHTLNVLRYLFFSCRGVLCLYIRWFLFQKDGWMKDRWATSAQAKQTNKQTKTNKQTNNKKDMCVH